MIGLLSEVLRGEEGVSAAKFVAIRYPMLERKKRPLVFGKKNKKEPW